MVLLFSNRKNKLEKEIIEILTACGADFVSDKFITASGGYFTVAVCYKKTLININKGVALILDDTHRFINQELPIGITGICEDNNEIALKLFKANGLPVITCGNNAKNTLTISSVENNNYLVTLQREIIDINGNTICPADYKITLQKAYSPEAVMLSCGVLCMIGGKF